MTRNVGGTVMTRGDINNRADYDEGIELATILMISLDQSMNCGLKSHY